MTTITTVRDLIAELSTKDQNAPVFFATEHEDTNEERLIRSVEQYTDGGTERVILNDGGWE
jgi:hypothetical protein